MNKTKEWETELLEKLRNLHKILISGNLEVSRNYLRNIIGDYFEPD